ncbi:PspC domain-containing protein [Paenibacillus macerans]|uniref:PspC domain-containing protein n=1 Tax=Paenibacillus macerans TaxID=44252 RepID=UPI003D317AC2
MRKLYRSVTDKQISGLCGGLAAWLGVDSTVVRLIAVVAVFFSFGTVVALYLIASIIVPKEPIGSYGYDDPFSQF